MQRLTLDDETSLTKCWPEWCVWSGSGFERYAFKFCARNHWRVRRYLGDFEDCMQQCACEWVYCRNRYGCVVNNPAWFMALYKLSLYCMFNSYSNRDTAARMALERYAEVPRPTIEHSHGPFAAALGRASPELKAALTMLADAPAEIWDIALSGGKDTVAKSRALLRFAGQAVTHDILAELRLLLA